VNRLLQGVNCEEIWLKAQVTDFYDENIGMLVPRYDKYSVGAATMYRSSWKVYLKVPNKIALIFTVVFISRPIGL